MSFSSWNLRPLVAQIAQIAQIGLISLMALSLSSAVRADDSSAAAVLKPADLRPSRPTPRVYVTPNYKLTFQVPPNSFYCPLPDDWMGSDHGTIIFLEPPGACSGGGYASSSRSYERDVALIEIFYGYDLSEPADEERAPGPKACDAVAHARFFGRDTPLCKTFENGKLNLSATAKVRASDRVEANFTLVTTADRLGADLVVFRKLLASARSCRAEWVYGEGKKGRSGVGARCPSGVAWF